MLSPSSMQEAAEVEETVADDLEEGDNEEPAQDVEQTPKPVRRFEAQPKAPSPPPARPQKTEAPAAPSVRTTTGKPTAAHTREIEDLQTKLRMMEKRRLEDREKLKAMERLQQERDRFESIIQKLQTKYQPQQQEIAELKKQLQSSESSLIDIEKIQAEHDIELENATLDREMAEEQYEVLKAEVGALREKNEELELEVEVLREENQELGQEMNPEERTSQGWLQLERSNERLREALIRLRDVTQGQEADLKSQITALEQDAGGLDTLKRQAETFKEKLLESEAAVEDLKQQLEVSQGGEDMIEELSERNMTLQEQIEELKATVDDLENLKELNDELEVNHIETEKQMQEEIDFKDSVINEQARRTNEQQRTVDDYELTISRFREAFRSLQADLEDMRASQQISETEADDLNSKSRALINLNMKLQSSASKTQVKAIDLELKRLDAEEASQHLSIVQLFLPDAFQADRDSVLALLRFKRIGFKANLIHGMIKEAVRNAAHGYNLFAACSVLDRLAWISGISEEFISNISACPVPDFARYQGALYELEPVERALNTHIDALRREELDVNRVDEELQRSMAVLSHLASVHIQETLASSADDVVLRTSMLQSHLENAATALSIARTHVEARSSKYEPQADGQTEEDEDEPSLQPFFERIDALISYARGAKVIAGKAHRELSDLRARSLGLDPFHLQAFTAAESQASSIAAFARATGDQISALTDSDEEQASLDPRSIISALKAAATTAFSLKEPEREPLSTVHSSLRSLTEQLNQLHSLSTDLDNTLEFERPPAPWTLRAHELKITKSTSADTEVELKRLTETLAERNLLVRTKEQDLDEQSLRIEMLEARMKESSKKNARIEELETTLLEAKKAEKKLADEAEKAAGHVTRLRSERDDWRSRVQESEARDKTNGDGRAVVGGASKLELDRASLRVKSLEQVVRALTAEREELRRSRTSGSGGGVHEDLAWLSQPLVSRSTAAENRRELLKKETRDVMRELLNLTTSAKPVDLTPLNGKDKLAWRPVRETSRWITGKRREDLEVWKSWAGDVARRVDGVQKKKVTRRDGPTKTASNESVQIVGVDRDVEVV